MTTDVLYVNDASHAVYGVVETQEVSLLDYDLMSRVDDEQTATWPTRGNVILTCKGAILLTRINFASMEK